MTERSTQYAKEPGLNYLSMELGAVIARRFGDRGSVLIGIAKYLRWVDDTVDNPNISRSDRQKYLDRQKSLLSDPSIRNRLHEHEINFFSLPWDSVGTNEPHIRHQVNIVIHSIEEDLQHEGFIARTAREIKHYNWRSLFPCFEMASLILNGKQLRAKKVALDFVDELQYLGAFADFEEDIEQSLIKFGLPREEVETINAARDRKTAFLNIMNRRRFYDEKKLHLRNLTQTAKSIFDTNLPMWQKAAAYLYLTTKSKYQRRLFAHYPTI